MWRLWLKTLALPPAINLLLLVLALLLWRRARWLSGLLAVLSVGSLYLLSTPFVTQELEHSFVRHGAIDPSEITVFDAQAIVVLGGGRDSAAAEYGGRDTLAGASLARARYGAWLARASGLPILFSGGKWAEQERAEAELAQEVLAQEFGVPLEWIEPHSRNTWENAQFSADILLPLGRERIVLVTHAFHMNRAARFFEAQGFQVLPAPTGFYDPVSTDPVYAWLPNVDSLYASVKLLHEMLGIAWYGLLDSLQLTR